jgi:hypothetical protein
MDVLSWLIDFIKLYDVGVFKFSENVNFLKDIYALWFFITAFKNTFQGKPFTIGIISTCTAVNFSEITTAKNRSNVKFV